MSAPLNTAEPASATTTVVGPSQPPSRVGSPGPEKKTVSQPSSIHQNQSIRGTLVDHKLNDGKIKDRAPAFVIILCLFQSLAGLLFGWESGVISGLTSMVDYQRRFGAPDAASATGFSIPSTRQSLIVSFMGLGALFGSLLAGIIASKLGMKKASTISLLIFLVGVAVEVSGQYQWGQIIAGRLIAGYGIGSLSMLAPLYQAECSPRHLRGILTSTYQLAATLGIFLSNAVNYNTRKYTGALSWRLPLAIQMIIGFFVLIGTIAGPESPRYFVEQGKIDQARANLSKLRDLPIGDPELEAEVDELVRKQAEDVSKGEVSYIDCFRSEGKMRLRTFIGIGIQAAQQWSGVNFFFSYGVKFFAASGITDSYQVQVILSAVNVVSTFPGLWAVENLGRRQTLLIGSGIMFTGQVVAGAVATAYPEGEVAGKILIAFSCIFIFGFAASIGPLGWVCAAEQFSGKTAAYCVAFATASNWINNFILAIITPYMTDAPYGNLQSKITFVWAGAIVLSTLFIFFFIRETAGLSLIQVDEMYLAGVPAWRSANWVPFGGDSKRNEKEGAALKLEHGQHVEVANRNLEDD